MAMDHGLPTKNCGRSAVDPGPIKIHLMLKTTGKCLLLALAVLQVNLGSSLAQSKSGSADL